MNFFDDDPFEEIVREFFGNSPVRRTRKRQFIHGEGEDRVIDFIEDDKKIYLIFELPGFNEKDISIKIKSQTLEISAKKSNEEGIQTYLNQKLRQGIFIKKNLPHIINKNKMKYSVNNGVLEIIFDKQKGGKNGLKKIKID